MTMDDQADTRAFLAAPETHDGAPVEVIETHISVVFLVGTRAFKLKRAVKLPYADFTDIEARLATCQKEYDLNAPHARGLYLGVRRITRAAGGGLEFDGDGAVVDAVVEMARFDQSCLFDAMARDGRLTADLMDDLALAIAEFHDAAPQVPDGDGADNIAGVLDINRAGFATSSVFADSEVAGLDRAVRAALARHAATLDARAAQGWIRRCHGDLHLRNICLFEGRPTLFDCIEFSDRLATIDVLYDLAFLLMDLWDRGLPDLANQVANRWFDATGGDDGYDLLAFFMAVRAQVRAHVIATQAERGGAQAADCAATARQYFDLACRLLDPAPPVAVAIGGLSGSGKTTLSEALAAEIGAPPGARIVESDRTRKAMYGLPADTRLPPTAYRDAVSDQVYDCLGLRASALARAGASVVVDGVFDRPDRRDALMASLAATGVPHVGIWLEADPHALRARVRHRRGGPSDADTGVLDDQLARDIGPISWTRISTARPLPETLADLRDTIRRGGGPRPAPP